jgi:predicted AlkP superfamily pyrophosphatase or phosphodiesterase
LTRLRSRSLAAAAALAVAAHASVGAQRASTDARAQPTLVVLIAVDQMRADYFERFASQFTGGLGRLYKGGAFFTNAYQDHAVTETAPGHSVMLSGRFPSSTGIVTNTLGVPDPQAPLIGGGGPGASPFRFQGSALIDWMRAKDPRSRALSVSRKDRGAILPIGRAHQSVFWYASDGRFTTSAYYADTLPTWVTRFNARRIPASYSGKTWDLLLPASAYPEPDSIAYESWGENFTFPHIFAANPAQVAREFAEYPMMDSMTAQFALEGVRALGIGAGPSPDLLSVSFSTTDAVGHRYGPDSRELHDQIIRLDRYLGMFIDSLYKLRDSSRVIFALTADHGVAPIPELRAEREHTVTYRVNVGPQLAAIENSLAAAGVTTSVIRLDDGLVTVAHGPLERAHMRPDSVVNVIAKAIRSVPGVQRVDFTTALAHDDTTTDDVARRWMHMLGQANPAELAVTLVPYAYWAGGIIATHGAPHDYDAHVPVLFYGPGIAAERLAQRALVADIAPTLAALIGVVPTERLDGQVRREIVK